ncbi:fungal-specific transcription factor domain-containing protein [Neohortaea acidophila]|uniref:Fungal-specific transcription factor domain-containing protein n=1 Tax=Neohortaea acidophila TaxID=245834 RepID=A0A6A6PX63_9PEZI|nr:fungal-specific transcription factor domain-containing protein [Neohortaea acidophila]KAF2484314.1 fungal-specific transcription factor domain-containing protein [Neohortaea acidophila]
MSLIPLETPVLKVSRPVAACSRCRNAKIKCDGKLPACTSCEKNGRAAECTSTNDQFARGKERSYVSTLETRIDRLLVKLEEAQARKPSVISVVDDDMSSRRTSQAQEPPTPNNSRKLRRREVSAIDDLVSDFGFLSVNATARDFYGFTTAMSYARLVLSACTKDPLPKARGQSLPNRQAAVELIQHYLDNIFSLLPMFDESSFYGSVENIYAQDVSKTSALDHWMVRMVLAIAHASKSTERGDWNYLESIGHVCAALEFAEYVLHPGNISGVQALLLLTQYATLDPHHFDSWSLIGAVSRAMADLGLHQDPPKGAPMSRSKLELRRKVFHCIYALDRATSLVQTRAFSFSDDSAKVKVPFHKLPSSAPPTPKSSNSTQQQNVFRAGHEHALELVSLRQIQSAWYTDLFQSGRESWPDPYSYIWDKCAAMRTWFDGLSSTTPASLRAFFLLDLLYSYIYVLSPSPRAPQVVPFAQKLIFEYCIQYAELLLSAITTESYIAPVNFYDAMRATMVGRQFLDVLQHNTDLLLDGFVPQHPEVKPTAAAPPPVPPVSLPPGETVRRYNAIRSINCIKNISKCLELLGIRWGYMSWTQRFQKEANPMLEQLQQRLREIDEMKGMRKQSVWAPQDSMRKRSVWAGSVSSHPSSNGSISYSTPPQHMANGYQQQSPPDLQQTLSFVDPGVGQRLSPSMYPPQPDAYPQQQQQQFHVPHDSVYTQLQQDPQQQQSYASASPPQQTFNFNEPFYQSPPNAGSSTAPGHQFAAWTGYSGPVVQDTLDEENAVPPKSNAWDLYQT